MVSRNGRKTSVVAVRDDEAEEIAASGVHRADDVPAQMSTMVALDRTDAATRPLLVEPGIALDGIHVAEEDIAEWVGEKIQQFEGAALTPTLPCLAVGCLGTRREDIQSALEMYLQPCPFA